MGYGYNKININVLKFDCIKDIDKIRLNHYMLRRENLNRLKKELPQGQFTMTISSVMKDLDISRGKAQRLIRDFEVLGIIKCVKKGSLNKSYSIYQYVTGDTDVDKDVDTIKCSDLKVLKDYDNYIGDTVVDISKKENIKRDLNKKNVCRCVVDYLNKKTGKNFKSSTQKTISCINARLNEGFVEADFYKVIDIKCSQWMYGDMAKFLRPETLFSNKFEGYLNEISDNLNEVMSDSQGWDIEFDF